LENGKIQCTFEDKKKNELPQKEVYDTVLLAIGRDLEAKYLNLDIANVVMNKQGKIITNKFDQTTEKNIYAIGDCATGVNGIPELTPVAIDSGKLLAERLFDKSS